MHFYTLPHTPTHFPESSMMLLLLHCPILLIVMFLQSKLSFKNLPVLEGYSWSSWLSQWWSWYMGSSPLNLILSNVSKNIWCIGKIDIKNLPVLGGQRRTRRHSSRVDILRRTQTDLDRFRLTQTDSDWLRLTQINSLIFVWSMSIKGTKLLFSPFYTLEEQV